ncbi:agmatine deiminase family protein [Glaciecola sp. 1036]|uniref:agmatine deiminase family protein n=1 Tax=Alteromonadaceae TaxID=72275 RepID=UPI003CFBCF2A
MLKASILIGLLFLYGGILSNLQAQEMRFSYPPEWSEQSSVWIGWPLRVGEPGSELDSLEQGQASVRAQMVKHLSTGSRVSLLVSSEEAKNQAIDRLTAAQIDLHKVDFYMSPVEDVFVRDLGPRFLSNEKQLKIADIPWKCYGYTRAIAGDYVDECLARKDNDNSMAQQMGLEMISSSAYAEGGALEATSTLLMGYLDTALSRNPNMTKAQIEADYLNIYGKQKMIWLTSSPVSDRPGYKAGNFFGWGANGHVDEYARFVNENTVVIAQIDESELSHALAKDDFETLKENLAELKSATDINGNPLNIIEMPAADPAMFGYQAPLNLPSTPEGWTELSGLTPDDIVTYVPAVSYMNFIIANDKIIVPEYWVEGLPEIVKHEDKKAGEILQSLFPDREVVRINPLPINWWGGGMHCSTQQQPLVKANE